MPRRYRIDWMPETPACRVWSEECSSADFEAVNNPDDMGDPWNEIRALTLGQSVTLGGGAAPITVITCIEE